MNRSYTKYIEFFISLIFGTIAYFCGSQNLTEALVWFLFPIIVCMLLKKDSNESYISKEIKDLALQLDHIRLINPEIYELYNAELGNIHEKIGDCINSKLFVYSYTPDLKLYKIVCSQLMKQFSGIDDRDFFYATAKCDRETVEWFFDYDQISRIFLPQLYEKLEKKQILKFYRLFIYNDDDMNDPLLWLLWLLHRRSAEELKVIGIDFQFKIIPEENFRSLTNNSAITNEMGVWGQHCVFIQKGSQQESGYSFDEETKKQYRTIFETIWSLAFDIDYKILDTEKISEKHKDNKLRREIADKLKSIEKDSENAILNNGIDLRKSSLKDIKHIQSWIKTIEPLSISVATYEPRIF